MFFFSLLLLSNLEYSKCGKGLWVLHSQQFGCSSIVHFGAPAEFALFFQLFERILANGTICHILSLKRWVHWQFHVDGKWNTELESKCLKNILCVSIWTWSDWICCSDLLRESCKELIKCSRVVPKNMELHQTLNKLFFFNYYFISISVSAEWWITCL